MSLTDFLDDAGFNLLSTKGLLSLPPPTWLMDKLIPENGLVGLYGAPSGGKSFVALDWAMSISEGIPWLGRFKTKQAPVIYIAAEGGRGIQKRAREWMRAHDKSDLPAMYWLLSPLYVREEGMVEAFIEELEKRDVFPGLVVFDTLSRSFGNGDENSSADMGHFIDSVMRLAVGRHMSALIVHHTNATGARERGHSAFRGNLDAMFSCIAEKNGDGRIVRITLANDKQKDDVEADAIYVAPAESSTGSLVFEETTPPDKKERGQGIPGAMRKLDMLALLGSHSEGLTWKEWQMASQVDKDRFSRRLRKLKSDGEIFNENGRYFVTPATRDLVDIDPEDDEEDD